MTTSRTHWYPAYVGVGSNLQSPTVQVLNAFELLDSLPQTRLYGKSSLYRSSPFGGVEQPDFVNAVASLLTTLPPFDLLVELKRLEQESGREKDEVRWGPRVLDLDLLVYSRQKLDDPTLTIPHPGIRERNFVLLPLLEIAPDLHVPGLGTLSNLEVNTAEPEISRIES